MTWEGIRDGSEKGESYQLILDVSLTQLYVSGWVVSMSSFLLFSMVASSL